MLNSAEHEILNAHEYKKIKKISIFSGSDKPRMLFFLLSNVKMPTFMSRKNFNLSSVVHENLYNLVARGSMHELDLLLGF